MRPWKTSLISWRRYGQDRTTLNDAQLLQLVRFYSVEIVNDRGTYYDQLQYTYHPCGRGAPLTEYYYFFGFALMAIIVAAQALMGV